VEESGVVLEAEADVSPFSAKETEVLRSYVGSLLAAEIALQLNIWNYPLSCCLLKKNNIKKQQTVNI